MACSHGLEDQVLSVVRFAAVMSSAMLGGTSTFER